jgi:aminoglycoside phosphotransferase (APT) family kinase protein
MLSCRCDDVSAFDRILGAMWVIFPEVMVSAATIRAIVARFALGTRKATPFVHSGTSHVIFMLDDTFVLRIPRNHPACISSVAIEAIAVPAARAAGVHTPELIAVDATLELLPVPYAIYEQVHGVALEHIGSESDTTPDVWRRLGQDLARLHGGVRANGPVTEIAAATEDLDPRPWLQEIAAADIIAPGTIDYFEAWLDRLAPIALIPPSYSFCHGDVNRGNILIDRDTRAYLALIDWAGVFWGDRAYDFAVVSLSVVRGLPSCHAARGRSDHRSAYPLAAFTGWAVWHAQCATARQGLGHPARRSITRRGKLVLGGPMRTMACRPQAEKHS